jgi:mono/diheme cytochrome c family protein
MNKKHCSFRTSKSLTSIQAQGHIWIMILLMVLLTFLLSACSLLTSERPQATKEIEPTQESQTGMMQGMGGGMGPGMMGRHHATIPAEYARKTSPSAADEASLGRGQAIYDQHCATCHGESGMGEGPAGAKLDPPASPIAHTSQMLADDYLFWRLSEGGMPFKTAMPAWKDILSEEQRWDVLHYVRALGSQGATAIATAQAARQDEMLKRAVEQGVIEPADAEIFRTVHNHLENAIKQQVGAQGNMTEREAAALQALVQQGKISQQQAAQFQVIHDKLANAGLMP